MRSSATRRRRASALLLILFLMALTAPLVCVMLDTHATHIRCVGNHLEQMTALYAAQAGVHDAVGELLADPSWRTGFTDKALPGGFGHTYTVTLADAVDDQIEITSTGRTASGHTKTVVAYVSGF